MPPPAARAPPGRPSAARSRASSEPARSPPSSTTRGSRPTARARATASRMRSGRSGELRAVVAGVESLARRRLLTSTRMPAAFLQLQRNAEFWPTRSFPKAPRPERKPCTGAAGLGGGARDVRGRPGRLPVVSGPGPADPAAGELRQGQRAVARVPAAERAAAAGRRAAPPCRPEELRALLDRMVALASQRGGFTAWEYFFAFGGGTPPWISGLAQGTAIQALTRGSQLLGDPTLRRVRPRRARRVRGQAAARRPRALDERARPPLPHLLVLLRAARAQRLPAVARRPLRLRRRDEGPRAQRLFRTGDRAARREIPRYDTGAWSLYASGGAESDLGYHRLVRDFLQSLCDRTRDARYCGRAKRFDRYLHERTRVGFGGVGAVRLGADANVRFTLSKLSCVTLRVRRGGDARARAQARDAARPARPHLPPAARGPLHASRSRPSTSSTTTRGSSTRSLVKPRRGRRAPRA